jgi:hypothetical protein
MQFVRRRERFERDDKMSIGLRGEQDATCNRFAVEQNRARAARAVFATVLDAPIPGAAQCDEQSFVRRAIELFDLSVQRELNQHLFHPQTHRLKDRRRDD